MVAPKNVAFLFDVDGVIAETPHEESWKQAAVEWSIIPDAFHFTPFYVAHVAGEPGLTGAYRILGQLTGQSDRTFFSCCCADEPSRIAKAHCFRDRKQRIMEEHIRQRHYRPFKDIVDIVMAARKDDIPIAAVSSSENAENVLLAMREDNRSLLNIFNARALGAIRYWRVPVDKSYHYAMAYGKLLGALYPRYHDSFFPRVVVFEDAPRGIEAVTKLGFIGVGISRVSSTGAVLATPQQLRQAGARLVYSGNQLAEAGYDGFCKDLTAIIYDMPGGRQ
jgi:beta-phosphoglucomutase-like phosphatase (HAD superfamily)